MLSVAAAGMENRCCGEGLFAGGGDSGKVTLEGELGADSRDMDSWLAVSLSEISKVSRSIFRLLLR